MRQLANYKIEGLLHMRILLVDQHVEGDDQSALQWVLRADVERTALLEDEQRLLACQHGNADVSTLPPDLQVRLGVFAWFALFAWFAWFAWFALFSYFFVPVVEFHLPHNAFDAGVECYLLLS
jgi:hypothetical protein